jgi:hypothetical protein
MFMQLFASNGAGPLPREKERVMLFVIQEKCVLDGECESGVNAIAVRPSLTMYGWSAGEARVDCVDGERQSGCIALSMQAAATASSSSVVNCGSGWECVEGGDSDSID